jgi:hypothetical protein
MPAMVAFHSAGMTMIMSVQMPALAASMPRRGKGRQGRDWKLLEHDPAGSGSFKKWSHPFIK